MAPASARLRKVGAFTAASRAQNSGTWQFKKLNEVKSTKFSNIVRRCPTHLCYRRCYPVPQHRPASFKTTHLAAPRCVSRRSMAAGSVLFGQGAGFQGGLLCCNQCCLASYFPATELTKAGWQDDRPIGIHRQCRYRNGKWFPKFPWSWFGPCPSLGFWMMNPNRNSDSYSSW